ncbi:hypothetical protein HPB48_026775 [Haemaphysalis longicornis]|uniref:Uncharacterized protein n=1 Tax=Haemaphysalis longicornis TaxID=44386 RepID=A0A9J6HCD5_HAELO|nr:hypothetical protein HPB48_026775 [Haemaphysalis longicornis]
MVATTASPGLPHKYQHTDILRSKQPCHVIDEQLIRLERIITHHISAHPYLSEEDPLPKSMLRYLAHSNLLALEAVDPEVRHALLAIASLPVIGKDVPFQANEAVCHN